MSEEQKKRQQKKTELRVAGGGIGGFLVLGGALAAVALVGFLRNRSKRRPTNKIIKNPPTDASKELSIGETGDGAHGLPSPLQTPSHSAKNHQCDDEASRIHSTMIGSCESVAIKSLIVENYDSQINVETHPPKWVNGEMDSDNSKGRNPNLNGEMDSDNSKGSDLSAADDYDDITKNGISRGRKDVDHNKEDTAEETLVETADAFRESMDNGEENPSMQLLGNNNKEGEEEVEQEDDVEEKGGGCSDWTGDFSMDESVEDKGEGSDGTGDSSIEDKGEGSDGTGDSSMESNAEAIWPVDTIIEGPLERQKNSHIKSSGKTTEKQAEEDVPMLEVVGRINDEKSTLKIVHLKNSRAFLLISTMVGILLLLLSHLIAKCYHPSSDSLPSNAN